MRHIRSYVDNTKAKEVGGDSRVKNLSKDTQQLAGDVEDLIDEFLPKIQPSNMFKGAICCLKTSSFADEFAKEIEKIKRRVVDIDRIRTTYNIIDTDNNNDDCVLSDRRRLFLHADETKVIGLDDDFNMLQAKLLDQDFHYGVVSIVGMPDLGKTTLAKKLYRHVRDQVECSGLVYVSQQPRAGKILHGTDGRGKEGKFGGQPAITLENEKKYSWEMWRHTASHSGDCRHVKGKRKNRSCVEQSTLEYGP
ncbi:hypothetical protein RDI58_022119 [Solanum bulbocastanum]|uniref:NB-ARC domain-containing protein n=1 Tax=Solanum bulbocastanum TaxID=147425 RepID=A0AAN8Y4Y3_SOLBU